MCRKSWWIALALGAVLLSGCGRQKLPAHFVHQISWVNHGQWLKADLHTHTKFSDGAHTVAEVVEKAAAYGCQVVAITDHADRNLPAATRQYFEEIEAARRTHPEMVVLAGLEWNVPPFGGKQHANVFLASAEHEGPLLAHFKEAFDELGRDDEGPQLADEALRWLAENGAADGLAPIVLYNHPSRKRASSTDIVAELVHMRQHASLVAGLEGGPGHQRPKPLGSYIPEQPLVDRWDPAVARIGDAWDQLLGQGIDIWAAEAVSDFHDDSPSDLHDYWPGQFAETWLFVPEKSRKGVLQALHEGTYFGVHGHIARQVEIQVMADGLPRPAQAGETIAIPAGCEIQVVVHCQVPATDWEGNPNQLSQIELIAIDDTGARSIAEQKVNDTAAELRASLVPSGKGVVLRARGRRTMSNEPDLMFYSNPVRVQISSE